MGNDPSDKQIVKPFQLFRLSVRYTRTDLDSQLRDFEAARNEIAELDHEAMGALKSVLVSLISSICYLIVGPIHGSDKQIQGIQEIEKWRKQLRDSRCGLYQGVIDGTAMEDIELTKANAIIASINSGVFKLKDWQGYLDQVRANRLIMVTKVAWAVQVAKDYGNLGDCDLDLDFRLSVIVESVRPQAMSDKVGGVGLAPVQPSSFFENDRLTREPVAQPDNNMDRRLPGSEHEST